MFGSLVSCAFAVCFVLFCVFFAFFVFLFFSDELQAGSVLLEGRVARTRETWRVLHDLVTLEFFFVIPTAPALFLCWDGFC